MIHPKIIKECLSCGEKFSTTYTNNNSSCPRCFYLDLVDDSELDRLEPIDSTPTADESAEIARQAYED